MARHLADVVSEARRVGTPPSQDRLGEVAGLSKAGDDSNVRKCLSQSPRGSRIQICIMRDLADSRCRRGGVKERAVASERSFFVGLEKSAALGRNDVGARMRPQDLEKPARGRLGSADIDEIKIALTGMPAGSRLLGLSSIGRRTGCPSRLQSEAPFKPRISGGAGDEAGGISHGRPRSRRAREKGPRNWSDSSRRTVPQMQSVRRPTSAATVRPSSATEG